MSTFEQVKKRTRSITIGQGAFLVIMTVAAVGLYLTLKWIPFGMEQ